MQKCLRFTAIRMLALASMVAPLGAADSAAERAFKAADLAVRAGDSFKAYVLYAEAAQLDPQNSTYSERMRAMRSSPALVADAQLAPDPAGSVEPIAADPAPANDLTLEPIPPPQLKASIGTKSFNLKGDGKAVLEGAGAALGIEMVFDSAYEALPSVTFRVDGANFENTLRMLERVTDSFFVPLNEKAALVVRDNPQNRTQFTPTMSVAVLIPERLSVQEAQELVTAVQQILEVRRISLDPTKRLAIFRDSVSKAIAARDLFLTLSRSRAQIAVDIDILSVGKTSSLSYGLSLPTSSTIVDFGKSVASIVNVPGNLGGFTNFIALGGGATPWGLGIANAAAFATLSKASSQTLLSLHMVSLDGQAASFHVGDRYPVIAATFSGLTTDTEVSPTLVPTVNYVDLGIVMKLTPTVHAGGEVTLDLDAEFKTLGAGGANGIPAIASREYQGKVRLKDGEWAVVAGLVSLDKSETPTGVAGLSQIPVLGHLFTRETRSTDSAEVLIVLKPHLVAQPPWEEVSRPMWTGTETRPRPVF